ncbi:MAG TPA: hypothetical protein VD970_19150 [Acetobacteraceae bacterium]|nr:hypothetical protein [Acetobacteraceae bacterium]
MVVFDPADPTRVQPVSTLPPSAGEPVRGGFIAAFALSAVAALLFTIAAILRRGPRS